MKRIAIASKRSMTTLTRNREVFARVIDALRQSRKTVYIEPGIAEVLELKEYKPFVRGETDVDLILVMGGDGTTLSVVRQMGRCDTKIFGINLGTLGFLSEIPPVHLRRTLNKIFRGEYTLDKRAMVHVEVHRGRTMIGPFHALNEAVISQGALARLIRLRTTVNQRKLTTYQADGLIVATPTGSTAYNLSAGGPILYPSMSGLILTPICPHSFTQKSIVIPDNKKIDIVVEDDHQNISLTLDGQESVLLKHKDRVSIRKSDRAIHFVRLPSESFFNTLREKLGWGSQGEK